jgi:hypothetical protein
VKIREAAARYFGSRLPVFTGKSINVSSTGRKLTFNIVIASVRQLPGEAIQ